MARTELKSSRVTKGFEDDCVGLNAPLLRTPILLRVLRGSLYYVTGSRRIIRQFTFHFLVRPFFVDLVAYRAARFSRCQRERRRASPIGTCRRAGCQGATG